MEVVYPSALNSVESPKADYQIYLFTNECTRDCLKNSIKIYIKTSPTCFGAVTPSSGCSLSVLPRLVVFLALQPTVVVFSQPSSGLYLPRFRGFLITHNDAPQSIGFLWTSDQPVAEISI